MESRSEDNPIDLLEMRLGADWPAIRKARVAATEKREQLRVALCSLDVDDTSIVIFGSLARNEFTCKSDIDWALLVDGIANPEHWDNALEIKKHIEEKPGPEATFGGLTISHDLIHRIGGGEDTNRNTTQRILLLLESRAIDRSEAYERVLRNVLRRYVDEDYGLVHSAAVHNVPRFLQNDIARYWRTVAVDFAYKQRQRAEKGWALRTVKLRISRKLTYVSGLLMCFSCETDEPKPLPEMKEDNAFDLHPIIDHLLKYSRLTPLEILANALLPHSQLDETARTLFDTYNEFLAQLDNPVSRDRLEVLERHQVSADSLYQDMRELSHTFQDALTQLFLEENGTRLWELTKVYGVF
jgi:predicted nucleotidyltransferase